MVTFNIENKKICGTGSIEHILFKYHWKCNHRTRLPFYHHIDLIMGGNFIQNTQTIWWWMAEGNNEKYIVSHVLPINAQYVWVCMHVCWRNHRNENGASAWKAHSNGCWPRGYLDTDDKEKKKKNTNFQYNISMHLSSDNFWIRTSCLCSTLQSVTDSIQAEGNFKHRNPFWI